MSGGPFDRMRWVAVAAGGYFVAAGVGVAAGTHLPGGRWLAIHIFTLGVLTNLVLALSDHFARTLTHQPGAAPKLQPVLANAGVLGILVGIPSDARWVVAAGATLLTGVVLGSYLRLRRLRLRALGPRFGWIVRVYERAHGAFVHGAILGMLLGTGLLQGTWVASGRLAHMHVMLLGWGGLTLLATSVFFGPTIARIRIEEGADARAGKALAWGTTALTLAALSLLGTGWGGAAGLALRLFAAAYLAIFAAAVTIVCLPVARVALRAKPTAGRWPVLATAVWFPIVVWADAAAIGFGSTRYLEAVGAAMLLGVLAQAIVVALGYFAPLLREGGLARDRVRRRLDLLAGPRAAAWNLGVVLVVAGPLMGLAPAQRAGYALVLAAGGVQLALTVAGGARLGPGPRLDAR